MREARVQVQLDREQVDRLTAAIGRINVAVANYRRALVEMSRGLNQLAQAVHKLEPEVPNGQSSDAAADRDMRFLSDGATEPVAASDS